MMSGKWEVVKVEMNHNDQNMMEVFLENYKSFSACCKYVVEFKKNNICTGTYYNNDTIVYSVDGVWELRAFNLLYVNIDKYVNAELDVDRHSSRYYTLESPRNKVKVFNDAEVHAKASIRKM